MSGFDDISLSTWAFLAIGFVAGIYGMIRDYDPVIIVGTILLTTSFISIRMDAADRDNRLIMDYLKGKLP